MKYEEILREYDDTWRVKRAEDYTYIIDGRWATIQPHNLDGSLLCAVCVFQSKRQKSLKLRYIQGLRLPEFTITQEGDTELTFTFRNSFSCLKSLRKTLGLYRRKYYPNRPLSGAALAAHKKKVGQ